MSNRLTQLLKEPLVQFLLIGAGIYGAYALYGAPDEEVSDRTIRVDSSRIERFIGEWERRWNRLPTRQELDGMIDTFVREDILYRQAVAMGLDEGDPITRRRMAQKLEFLTSDIARTIEPEEGELEQYFQDNKALYTEPDLISFSHVFIDPDLRGEATLDDAQEILTQLRRAGEPDTKTFDAGDRIMLQNYFPALSELDIRRQMGGGFSEAVMQLEPGQWHGPVLSGYGVHLVYVYSLQTAPPPKFDDLQADVLDNWLAEQREEFNAVFFESLKSRYDVVIDELPVNRIIDSRAEMTIEDGSGPGAEPAS